MATELELFLEPFHETAQIFNDFKRPHFQKVISKINNAIFENLFVCEKIWNRINILQKYDLNRFCRNGTL